jgi:type VI secretion system secreted protein Hcp
MNDPLRTQCSAIFGLILILTALTPTLANAAGYLKIAGVDGESSAKGHEHEIEVISWSLGAQPATAASTSASAAANSVTAQATSGSAMADPTPAAATGKRQHNPISFTKRVDKSSPMLKKASADHEVFPSVTLYLPNEGGAGLAYLSYELKDVVVSSYQTSAGQGGDGPTETITFVYGTLRHIE